MRSLIIVLCVLGLIGFTYQAGHRGWFVPAINYADKDKSYAEQVKELSTSVENNRSVQAGRVAFNQTQNETLLSQIQVEESRVREIQQKMDSLQDEMDQRQADWQDLQEQNTAMINQGGIAGTVDSEALSQERERLLNESIEQNRQAEEEQLRNRQNIDNLKSKLNQSERHMAALSEIIKTQSSFGFDTDSLREAKENYAKEQGQLMDIQNQIAVNQAQVEEAARVNQKRNDIQNIQDQERLQYFFQQKVNQMKDQTQSLALKTQKLKELEQQQSKLFASLQTEYNSHSKNLEQLKAQLK